MADNKRKKGKADRAKVARLQRYEVYYIAHKFGVPVAAVLRVIRRVGNNRKLVYAAFR